MSPCNSLANTANKRGAPIYGASFPSLDPEMARTPTPQALQTSKISLPPGSNLSGSCHPRERSLVVGIEHVRNPQQLMPRGNHGVSKHRGVPLVPMEVLNGSHGWRRLNEGF